MMRLVSACPPQKIAEDFQAGLSGFFRVKLNAHHVLEFNGGGEGFDVLVRLLRYRM